MMSNPWSSCQPPGSLGASTNLPINIPQTSKVAPATKLMMIFS
jgi:hypothetical protein